MEGHLNDELVALANHQEGPCLSIFMPVGRQGLETPGYELLDHLLTVGEQQILASAPHAQIDALLAPARDLVRDRAFWYRNHTSIALFLAPQFFRTYPLPYNVTTLVVSGMRFHLTPLFPLRDLNEPFFIMAISTKQVRLFQATWASIRQIEIPGAPASLAETLQYDEFAPQHQLHSGIPGKGGERGPIFHGQGATSDVAKDELLRYCQQIDKAAARVLRNQQAPLVLAGVSYLLAIYRHVTAYQHVLEESIAGNPDRYPVEQLRDHAWELLVPVLQRKQERAIEYYRSLAATSPQRLTSHLRTIVPAATAGHIEALFVVNNCHQWGQYDPVTCTLELHSVGHAGDADLFDIAGVQTMLHGGDVFVVTTPDMPIAATCAAILRP